LQNSVLIPNKLYKYHSNTDYALPALINGNVWFSTKKYLNDPFEFININYEISDEKYTKTWNKRLSKLGYGKSDIDLEMIDLLRQKDSRMKTGSELIEKSLKSMGLYCLTTKPDNILMWSHYADSHKGFCIEFDTHPKRYSPDQHFRKVSYLRRYPKLTPFDFEPCGYCDNCKQSRSVSLDKYINCEFIGKNFNTLVGTKSKDWEYEDEYRVAHEGLNNGQVSEGFLWPMQKLGLSVSAIILGSDMPEEETVKIRYQLEDRCPIRFAKNSKRDFRMIGCV